MPGGRGATSFLALLVALASVYVALLGLDLLPQKLEAEAGGVQTSAKEAWELLLALALVLLAAVVAGVLLTAALVLIAALLLRIPPFGGLARWVARSTWADTKITDGAGKRIGRRILRLPIGVANLLAGYDLIVDEFRASASADASAPAAVAIAGGPASGAAGEAAASPATDGAAGAAKDPAAQLADDAATVSASTRATLGVTGLPSAPGGIDFVRGTAGSGRVLEAIADAMKEVSELKWLAPLIRLGRAVLPRQTYVLHGHLFPAGERGRGLALSFGERGAGVLANKVLWERTFDPALGRPTQAERRTPQTVAEALYRLGIAAAAWTVYEVLDVRRDKPRKARLGSPEWLSYAYFHAGVECQQALRLEKAIALYTRALERDPANKTALFNHAVLKAHGFDDDRRRDKHVDTPFDRDRARSRDALAALRRVQELIDRADERGCEARWCEILIRQVMGTLSPVTEAWATLYRRAVCGAWKIPSRLLGRAGESWDRIKCLADGMKREPLWYQAAYQRAAATLIAGPESPSDLYRETLTFSWELEKALLALELHKQWPESSAGATS